MRKYVYAALMVLYIGFSIATIYYASKKMEDVNYSTIASKARDIAITTANNYRISNSEVEEVYKLKFNELNQHPANIRLANMFNDQDGYDDIRFVYVMVKLDNEKVPYHVTEDYVDFYEAEAGTPLNLLWLLDVVIGKTRAEILDEDKNYYDDIRRYSYVHSVEEPAFENRKPLYEMVKDEYGTVICGLAPLYTEEGEYVGMLGVDINIEEYEANSALIRLLLLIVFLLPSVILSVIYIVIYIINLRKLHDTAHTDPLTSVKNRRHIEKHLPQIVKEHFINQQPLSLIMIDIDHFKNYNDNYGHQQGDKVLVETTKAIASVLREKMDAICRYGGEEFVVILTKTKISDAGRIAERIKSAVDKLAIKHEHSAVSNIVTISQGIYSAIPSDTDSDKTFIEYADKGLYEAKNSGRNKYVHFLSDEDKDTTHLI